MIKTKHGSRIEIMGLYPAFVDSKGRTVKRCFIQFNGTGSYTWANVSDLRESKKGEIAQSIAQLKRGCAAG